MTSNAQIVKCDFSNPRLFNPFYVPYLKDQTEFLHFWGSAGSGKSRFVAQKEVILSFDSRRHRKHTLVIRKVGATLATSVYAEIKEVIYSWQLQGLFKFRASPMSITNQVTGVEFLFTGFDEPEKIKSIQGVDRIWIEEATELKTKAELLQLRTRIRGVKRPQVTLSYNPINVFHWLNVEVQELQLPGHRFIHSTYKDNVRMLEKDDSFAVFLEGTRETDPNYYRVYALGEWGKDIQGLVYPDFEVVAEDAMPGVQFYGLDFGYNDPNALVSCAVVDETDKDGNPIPGKSLYWKEEIYATRQTTPMLIAEMDRLGIRKDIPIVADSQKPETIEEISRAGYYIMPCTKYAGSVIEGIKYVKKFNLKIVAGSTNMFRELAHYSWKDKNGQYKDMEASDSINHLMDAGRYGLEWTKGSDVEHGDDGGLWV